MVSFENGKFILRKRDDRHHLRSRRSKQLRRVIVIALAFSFCYFISRRIRREPDSSLLRAAHHAHVKPHASSKFVAPRSSPHPQEGNDADDEAKSTAVSQGNEKSTDKGATINEEGLAPHSPSQSQDGKDSDGEAEIASGPRDNEQSPHQGELKLSDQCKISLSKKFLEYLQSLEPIPKKVHIFFPDKNYWHQDSIPFVKYSILSLKKLNPDWNVTVYDDKMVDDVIRKAGDSDIISREECDMLVGKKDDEGNVIKGAAHIVERSDIARLLLMYIEGGFYIDADRLISKRMEDVINPSTRMCLPTFNDVNFCQDLMCTSRGNDLFLSMVHEASKIRIPAERRDGWIKGGRLFDMGPVLYTTQILIRAFGGSEDTYHKCEKDDFAVAREMITTGSNGVIVTKKETACDDGLLVDDTLPECHDRKPLYDKYGMKRWGPEVNARWEKNEKR
eukprot:CAMPEP_0172530568 /NCGR_PEP_ID=MMETSP1067-20121228/4264_1 /TAXON_ID=265564 ORGANISM="Thalassiosira punctigera, Strain Tpunct2005C2" /NCGR_SAMPLE_ID=MMETSP1067 /ASSEMBLY_ACC=CAM_ASM_000444 /LENGTH=447 /DNA_ID=CAMNT_0013314805 /DNA_START=137 /DNA_END=1480 /DNA_ORIENTATION=+